jgi:hypothetical protein
MSYIVTITASGGSKEKVENVNDVSFVSEFMIMCMSDMKTRIVRRLSQIEEYKIVEQPVKKVLKKN